MCNLLVVEDEALIALELSMVFQEAQFAVSLASSIDEALAAIADEHFDAVVLDASLHGKWSAPVAHALERREIPYVIYSGTPRDAISEWAHPVTFLSKPLPPERLIEAISATVSCSQSKQSFQ